MAVACDTFLEAVLGAEAARVLAARLSCAALGFSPSEEDQELPSAAPGLERLAATVALPPARVGEVLQECRDRVLAFFGVDLLATRWDKALLDDAGLPRLSPEAEALASGSAGFRIVHANAQADAVAVDEASMRWIDLLVEAARQGRSAHFVYRMRSRDTSSHDYLREVEDLSATFAAAAGECLVLMAQKRDRMSWGQGDAFDALVSGILPVAAADAGLRGVLKIFPGPNAVGGDGGKAKAAPPADDEYLPPEEIETKAEAGLPLLAPLLPQLVGVHVWCCPRDVRLPAAVAEAVVGAFGPVACDPAAVRAGFAALLPPEVDATGAVGSLERTYARPRAARTLVAFAAETAAAAIGEQAGALIRRLASSLAPHLPLVEAPPATAGYDPALINADVDLGALYARADVLRERGARFLLHGEPGTGKSAFSMEMCRRMGLRLRERRGGDILVGKWGEAERRIWATMRGAETDGVALSFEECDSILADRNAYTGNNKYMIVSVVNEFLAALDRCTVPVFASTNDVGAIDPAIRRRFHVVVRLLPLSPRQERIAWRSILGMAPPRRLPLAGDTVPADYVAAGKRLQLFGERGASAAALHVAAARTARLGEPSAKADEARAIRPLLAQVGFMTFGGRQS